MTSSGTEFCRSVSRVPSGFQRKDYLGVVVPKHILPKKTSKDKQAVRLPRQKKNDRFSSSDFN